MKCEDVGMDLIAYAGGRANASERSRLEGHLAGCPACRAKTEEYRALSSVLDDLPAIEPSFGFDARVRARVAAEPKRGWFAWIPQPRLALSAAFLVVLSVWIVKMEPQRVVAPGGSATETATQQEDFNAINNLGVLENYDVVTNMDALSELAPVSADQPKAQSHARPDGGV